MDKTLNAWITDDGKILCMSEACNLHDKICPRFNECKIYDITIDLEKIRTNILFNQNKSY